MIFMEFKLKPWCDVIISTANYIFFSIRYSRSFTTRCPLSVWFLLLSLLCTSSEVLFIKVKTLPKKLSRSSLISRECFSVLIMRRFNQSRSQIQFVANENKPLMDRHTSFEHVPFLLLFSTGTFFMEIFQIKYGVYLCHVMSFLVFTFLSLWASTV